MSINYIGSKRSLVDFLEESFSQAMGDDFSSIKVFGDGFCGGGAVSVHFNQKYDWSIQSVDIELYSYLLNNTMLNVPYTQELKELIDRLSDCQPIESLVTKTYSPRGDRMFFTVENSEKIDAVRSEINNLPETVGRCEREFLLASLIKSADKVANISCVYGAYLKKFKKSAEKPFVLTPIHTRPQIRVESKVLCQDIFDTDWSDCDVVYFDPPYNNRQYGSNYFVLNYIGRYEYCETRGKTGIIDYYKSPFCQKREAMKAFERLLNNDTLPKYVFISYNDEGIIKVDEFKEMLEKHGKVVLFKKAYKKFKAQMSVNKNQVIEMLWFLERK